MPDEQTPVAAVIRFEGEPIDVGAQIWERLCLPAVQVTANSCGPEALAHLYSGFMLALLGALTADFGQEQALQMASDLIKTLAGCDIAEAARTH